MNNDGGNKLAYFWLVDSELFFYFKQLDYIPHKSQDQRMPNNCERSSNHLLFSYPVDSKLLQKIVFLLSYKPKSL